MAHGTRCLGSQRSGHSRWIESGAPALSQLPGAFVQCPGSQVMEGLMRCWAQPGTVPGPGVSKQPSALTQGA